MTTYAWPTTRAFRPAAFTWSVQSNDRRFESQLSGAIQTAGLPGARWHATLTLPGQDAGSRAQVEAFLARARREHRISLWNMARPRPRGTINHSGVTVSSAAAQFATSVQLAGSGANATVLAGDMLGVGGQLCMAAADALANGSGVITVALTHELRQALTVGQAVTLVRPTATFVHTSAQLQFPWLGAYHPELTVELVEVF